MMNIRFGLFEFSLLVLLAHLVAAGKPHVYIVTLEDDPVTSYKGGLEGLDATAFDSDEKIDLTRKMRSRKLLPMISCLQIKPSKQFSIPY